jgi:hypothetical protein
MRADSWIARISRTSQRASVRANFNSAISLRSVACPSYFLAHGAQPIA